MLEKLSPLDLSFCNLDTETTHQAIAIFCLLECYPEITELENKIAELAQTFPRLKKKIITTKGFHWVEDSELNLKNHLQFIHLDGEISLELLREKASKVFSEKLTLALPLWKIVVIGNPEKPELPAALLIKAHHAMTDGLAIRKLLFSLGNYDEQKKYHQITYAKTTETPEIPLPKLGKSILRLYKEEQRKAETSLLNGKTSNKRKIQVLDFAGEDFQIIKNKLGGSLNDLYLSIVCNAIALYHKEFDYKVKRLTALMPFNLRRSDDFTTLGNNLSAIGVPLPLDIPDPIEQHALIKAYTEEIKNSGTFGAYKILALINSKLPLKLRLKVLGRAASKTNFICTNVPGPKLNIYIAQSKVLGIYACPALIHQQGAAFALVTYVDKINMSLVYDPEIVSEGLFLKNCLQQSFNTLKNKLLN